jgi:hypothetical protein
LQKLCVKIQTLQICHPVELFLPQVVTEFIPIQQRAHLLLYPLQISFQHLLKFICGAVAVVLVAKAVGLLGAPVVQADLQADLLYQLYKLIKHL